MVAKRLSLIPLKLRRSLSLLIIVFDDDDDDCDDYGGDDGKIPSHLLVTVRTLFSKLDRRQNIFLL